MAALPPHQSAVGKERRRSRRSRGSVRYSEKTIVAVPKARKPTSHHLPILRSRRDEVTNTLVANAIGRRSMGSPVVGQRRDGEASIVAARDALFRVEAFPIVHAEKGPGDRRAMTATDIERASTPETGLIVEDELVVREPRWAEGFDRRGVIALLIAPEHPVLLVEIGAVSEVEHGVV